MKNRLCILSICILFILLSLLVIQGCVIIGYRNHFSRDLTPEQQSKVVWNTPDERLLSLKNDGRIFAINGKQMQKMVQPHPKAIVYQWSPHCTSEACLSLSAIQTHYKTDVCHKLEKRFYIDLLGEENYNATKEISWYRYAYFEKGKFVRYIRDPYVELDNK